MQTQNSFPHCLGLRSTQVLFRDWVYSTFKDSGPKMPLRMWFLGPKNLNVVYLDPSGTVQVEGGCETER